MTQAAEKLRRLAFPSGSMREAFLSQPEARDPEATAPEGGSEQDAAGEDRAQCRIDRQVDPNQFGGIEAEGPDL